MRNEAVDYLGNAYNPETGEINLEKTKQLIQKRKDKINIVLFGQTGVGKSALINAIFGDDIVTTGVGKPVTQFLEKIDVKHKGLTLWDTKGIEAKDYETTKKQLTDDIKNGLQEALDNNDDETFPHVAWLCIKESSSRVQESDLDLLKMAKQFGIPTVVVFTNTQGENGDEFVTEAKKIINKEYENFVKNRYVRVNSVPFKIMIHTIPKSGLEDLLQVTEECLSDAFKNFNNKSQEHTEKLAKEKAKVVEALHKAQEVDMQKKFQAMINSAKTKVHVASASAGTVGASPIPGSDAPIIAGIQSTLIYTLNSEFEVDANNNHTTTVIAGVLSTTAIAQIGKAVVANALKFIPGAGTLAGGALSASTAVALTEAIGHAYIEVLKYHFDEKEGKTILPSDTIQMMDKFKEYFKASYKSK